MGDGNQPHAIRSTLIGLSFEIIHGPISKLFMMLWSLFPLKWVTVCPKDKGITLFSVDY
jgi:hypothetical protein